MTVGDQIGRIVGAPAGSTVMHQNVAIAEAVVLSCFTPTPERNRVVYERGNFPSVRYLYQAQRDLEVVVCEDDGEIVEAIDERTLLVPISHVLFKSGEIQDVDADRQSRPRRRRPRDPRRLPVSGNRPSRRHRLERRFRRRGLGQVALRRPGQRLALRASGPGRAARARLHRLAGARGALRLRGGDALCARRRALPHRHAERAGALRGHARLRPDRGDRRRADPRELTPPDRSSDPARRGGRLRDRKPARSRPPWRHGHRACGRVPGGAQGALGAADPLRLPPGRGHPDRAALLHLGRRARARGRPDHARSSRPGRTSATSAPSPDTRSRG